MKVHGGVDIAAEWVDICVLDQFDTPSIKRFANTLEGLAESGLWLQSLGVQLSKLHMALEPTGRYGELLADFYKKGGCRVVLVQPFAFSRYAESVDIRGKSDKKSCFALAMYSKERGSKLRAWKQRTDLALELRDVQMLLRSLTKRSVAIQCQLKCGVRSQFVKNKLEQELKQCKKQLEESLNYALELLEQDPGMSRDLQLLMSIPGVGPKTAALLLTLIDFRAFKTSRALACFLGLTAKKNESGATIRGKERISKRGSTLVRGALFMPARSARSHNPLLRDFAIRLEDKGKHDWVVQMAVIRKLVTTAWALVTKQVEYNPNHVNPHHATPT